MRKRDIVRAVLKSGELSVAVIQEKTEMPRSSLNHHLALLRRDKIIVQRRDGRRLLNSVSPKYIQGFRKEFRVRAPKLLISGYTFDPKRQNIKTLEMLERAINFLKCDKIKVGKTVAFTTHLARDKIRETDYLQGDEEVAMDIEVYQNEMAKIEKTMRDIIEKKLGENEVIMDLTPLTKLFTIVSLSLAREYDLKAMYHAGERLIWV